MKSRKKTTATITSINIKKHDPNYHTEQMLEQEKTNSIKRYPRNPMARNNKEARNSLWNERRTETRYAVTQEKRFLISVQTRKKPYTHTHSTAKNICFTLIRTLDKIASFSVCISFAKLRTVFFPFFICCYYTGNNYHAHCTELCSWNRTNAALNRFPSFLTLNNEQGFR